jgi:hypothetical protein
MSDDVMSIKAKSAVSLSLFLSLFSIYFREEG